MKEEIKGIILGLIEKTEKDEVNWSHVNDTNLIQEEGPSTIKDDFAVSTSDYSINIFQASDSLENGLTLNAIRMNIHNSRGDIVTQVIVREDESDYLMIKKLLVLARQYVLGEDRLLRTIKGNLSKPGVLGKEDEILF